MPAYNNITIVGGGTAGYLAVAHLCCKYPNKNIRWIYPAINNPIGVGEGSVGALSIFLDAVGVSRDEVISHCNGSIKYGFKFNGFSSATPSFFHGFSDYDELWKKERVPGDLLHTGSHVGMHFDVALLTNLIYSKVQHYKNLSIIRSSVDYNDIRDTADIVIDCTGFSRSIIDSVAPTNNFISLASRLPNNSVYLYRSKYTNRLQQIKPYSIATAMDYGWCWNLFLSTEQTFGYVHYDKYDVLEEYIAFVEQSINGKIDKSKIIKLNFKGGCNRQHMIDCHPPVVAIGLSSCFIEPIESTSLSCTVLGIKLLDKFLNHELTINDFNESMNNEYEAIVNFVLVHYKHGKKDNEYWNSYKQVDVVTHQPCDMFDDTNWNAILVGMGQMAAVAESPVELALKKLAALKCPTFKSWLTARDVV